MVDINTAFRSENGGLPLLLRHLADDLACVGADHLIEEWEDRLKQPQWRPCRLDLYHFLDGLRGLDRVALDRALAEIKPLLENHSIQDAECSTLDEALVDAEHEWFDVVGRVKPSIRSWDEWAVDRRMRRMFAFARSGFLPIRSHVASAAGLLASPQKLKSSWDFFRSKLHDIKEVQRQAYVEGESFGLLDPIAFNDLIAQLERSQSRWAEASDRVKIAREKWDQLHTEYVAKRQQIIRLLRQMPESAHWALFRLSRWYPVEAAEA